MRLISYLLLCCNLIAIEKSFEGKIVEIINGDTCVIQVQKQRTNADGIKTKIEKWTEKITIQLYGVSAPKGKQPFAAEAKKEFSKLVLNKEMFVEMISANKKIVFCILTTHEEWQLAYPTSVNRTIVAQGMAWHDSKTTSKDTKLDKEQKEAQAAKRGLWAAKDPVAPWLWKTQ